MMNKRKDAVGLSCAPQHRDNAIAPSLVKGASLVDSRLISRTHADRCAHTDKKHQTKQDAYAQEDDVSHGGGGAAPLDSVEVTAVQCS